MDYKGRAPIIPCQYFQQKKSQSSSFLLALIELKRCISRSSILSQGTQMAYADILKLHFL
jgi:hypothetical protein